LDFELFEQLFSRDLAAANPVEDKVVFQKFLVFRIVVVLLTQQ